MSDDSGLYQSALRTNLFLRTLALARLSMAAGTSFASTKVTGFFSSKEGADARIKQSLIDQSKLIAQELGQLKGSVMKVGQLISIYGEHFLPPEANQILKSLQCQAQPLEWTAIRSHLEKELSPDILDELEIESASTACASLGQVHKAKTRTGETLALKVQYPEVDRAVDSDLRALKTTLSMARLFSQVPHLDKVFLEVQEMLTQELDYLKEADSLTWFAERLEGNARYLVPRPNRRYSTRRVLATQFIEGVKLDGAEVSALTQERRDELAHSILDLYFRELYEFGRVQTDPHFGNYLVQLSPDGETPDRLVLFDFGAVRELAPEFVGSYRDLTRAAVARDRVGVLEISRAMGFLIDGDPPELLQTFSDFCFLVVEPFAGESGSYDWKSSDLPKRICRKLGDVIASYRLRPPPREMIFLDRKATGVFTALAVLGARIDGRPVLQKYL